MHAEFHGRFTAPPALSLLLRPNAGRRAEGEPRLSCVLGDITNEVADAVVNPAGAGLVDLAIRRVAGPELLDAFHRAAAQLPERRLSRGRVLLTPGFALPAGHVIHCGPPVHADGPGRAREELGACYAAALGLARASGFRSVAFPAIATGVYRFPLPAAAEIAARVVLSELRAHGGPSDVRFVFTDAATMDVYARAAITAGFSAA